jgi:cytoskeletal protein RodZ
MSDAGWGIVFILGIVAAISLIASIWVWQVFRTQQANTASETVIAQDGAYRALAEEVTTATRKSAQEQERIAAELAEVRSRLAAIEKLLAEVG